MNYLAHLYLGRRSDLFMVGNLLGDFVRGRVEESGFEGEVAEGIRLHRAAMNYGAGYLITLYRRLGLSGLYRRLNNDETLRESLTEADREALAPRFVEDLRRFRERTGLSIVDWC